MKSASHHDSLHGTLLGIATEGPWQHAPLLALLPPQQSNRSRHRAWGFPHSYSCDLLLLNWSKSSSPPKATSCSNVNEAHSISEPGAGLQLARDAASIHPTLL